MAKVALRMHPAGQRSLSSLTAALGEITFDASRAIERRDGTSQEGVSECKDEPKDYHAARKEMLAVECKRHVERYFASLRASNSAAEYEVRQTHTEHPHYVMGALAHTENAHIKHW